MNFFLSSYTIRIHENLKSSEKNSDPFKLLPLKLDQFDTHKTDLFDVCENSIIRLKRWPFKDDGNKAYFSISTPRFYPADRKICGIINSGNYGISGDIIDVDAKVIVHKKETNHADSLPFFFLVYLPKDTNEGILILQRIGTYGIRGALLDLFSKHFSSLYPGFNCSINPLIPDQVVKNIITKGTIKKLRFIKFNVPTDKTDTLFDLHQEKPYNAELSFSSPSFFPKDKIMTIFNPGVEVKNLFELRDWGFAYDTIKIEVQFGPESRPKVINLSNFSKIRNYIDITSEVLIGDNGHPKFNSILKYADQLCNDMSKILYGDS
jgi:hypothetical protein